jgi:dTMP kinase
MFITIEGSNGVGKSTVITGLCELFETQNLSWYKTKEPTNSTLGNFVRDSEENLNGLSYACLIASDRYYHIENEINPALEKFDIVLSDRYVESSLVLQALDGVDQDFIWSINSKVKIPDLSIILYGNDSSIEKRLSERKKLSRFEKQYTRKQEQELYLSVFDFIKTKNFHAVLIENTVASVDETIKIIYQHIKKYL